MSALKAMNNLNNKLSNLDDIFRELNKYSIDIENFTYDYYKDIDYDSKVKLDDLLSKINNIKDEYKLQKRIINAFPNMKHKKHYNQLIYLKSILSNKKKSHK